jgi:hypothetical protein
VKIDATSKLRLSNFFRLSFDFDREAALLSKQKAMRKARRLSRGKSALPLRPALASWPRLDVQ